MQTNLDNYFARFLHKGGATKPTATAAAAAAAASAARNAETHPPVLFPVTPAIRKSTTAEVKKDEGNVHHSYASERPADDAGSALQQLRYNSPTGAGEGLVSSSLRHLNTAKSTNSTSSSSGSGAVVATLKRARQDDDKEEEEKGVVVPAVPRKPAVTVRGAWEEDDEDELALLLGSQEARQVRHADALQAETARVQRVDVPVPPVSSAQDSTRRAATACAMSSLAWKTSSPRTLEGYTRYFQRQFEYDLQCSKQLYNAFEPFFRDKALTRIANDATLCPVFHAAPAVTQEDIGALPGSVLRPYQLDGVQFLLNHFHGGMSCILADDMGLGKTAQISAFLHTLRQLHGIEGPHLIVAPLSTLTSWTRELARWAPQLRVVKYHGERSARRQARSAHHNRRAVFVTTPALINLDKGFFRKRTWVTVVVDEAHVLKSHNTAVTSVTRKLTTCYRVAVTGTPVHNRVQEVWSLMSVLYPWLIAAYDPKRRDPVRQAEECAAVLRRVMLRRTKATMELGIPPRIDAPLTKLTPTYVQQHLLAQLTTHALHDGESGQNLQAHLSHQRAVCNHPLTLRLLADEGRAGGAQESVEARMHAAGIPMDAAHIIEPSAKMRHLDTLLPELKAGGHRCLIFSNFTTTLDLLEAMCRLRGYRYERLDGTCNRVERELSMLRYNHPRSSCFLFLVTTTAGGVGVTLTGADTVILFDAHFNPQLDRQAADRAHRIGQTRTVHVHRLCLQGTVEEHIRDIAAGKASLGDFIVEGGQTEARNAAQSRRTGGQMSDTSGGTAGRITVDEIRAMFRRLEQRSAQQQQQTGSPTSILHADESHATENAMIADLLHVEDVGLSGSAAAARTRRGGVGSSGTFANPVKQTHSCFCCGDIMRPLEPLYHCLVCPKAYHATCIGERRPKQGEVLKRQWTCPRHVCALCSKPQAADGAIFMCDACPRSYCFDCLDPRYLEMDPEGARLLHVRSTYADMAAEEMEVKRSCYYITCLRCCGVVSSSSSSEEEEGGEDDDVDSDDEEGAEEEGSSDDVEFVDSSSDDDDDDDDDDDA